MVVTKAVAAATEFNRKYPVGTAVSLFGESYLTSSEAVVEHGYPVVYLEGLDVPAELGALRIPSDGTTPDAVKLWINTVFRDQVRTECEKIEQQAMLKVGQDQGHEVPDILARFVTSVVMGIAGMDLKDWK